jgi:hypothetical protein
MRKSSMLVVSATRTFSSSEIIVTPVLVLAATIEPHDPIANFSPSD